jgi:catechol 2,3-dioxygenase-like lactoylglutathione lyase family enzyme
MFKNTHAFSGFAVTSLAKAKEFYGSTLGIEVKDEGGMGLQLLIAGGNPIFVYEKENHTPAEFTILNFPVDDIDAAVDELTSKGITFEKYEGLHTDEKGIARGKETNTGPDIAWFKDPSGNILSVLQN